MKVATILVAAAFVAAGACATLGLAVSRAVADPAPQFGGIPPIPPVPPVPPAPPLAPMPPLPPIPPVPPLPPSLSADVLPNDGETLAAYSQRMKAKDVEVKAEAGKISLKRAQGWGGVWMMSFNMNPADMDGPGFGRAFRERVETIERQAAERREEGLRRRAEAEAQRERAMEQRTAMLEQRRQPRASNADRSALDAERQALAAERAALQAERRAVEAERRALEAERRQGR